MKNKSLEDRFLDERLMRNVSIVSVVCSIVAFAILSISHEVELFAAFEKIVKIIVTLLTFWAFAKFHWDIMKGMMGALLFALLYQEGFLVLGNLWGQTTDFDAFLIMGVQGSLYLAAQTMSFMMTIIIVINHFIIGYSRVGNYGNVIFNQITIIFKVFLYILLIIVNSFLNQPLIIQVSSCFEYISDLCIVIMVICIETQLDNFKAIKQDLLKDRKKKEDINE
ncbi:MAG: hypothetical protein KBS96_00915 [Lachnospiraceae bacterium]|nr:hypothetical protein [Candidatus Colinaster scatohippi]